MCEIFGVSRSGFYSYVLRKPSQRQIALSALDIEISRIFKEHHGWYGSPRIHAELKDLGFCYSRKTIASHMKKLGLSARKKKAFKVMDKHSSDAIYPNVLKRNFVASTINEKWVSDITYIKLRSGWSYLATVIDLYSRKVIGWHIDTRMQSELVCSALKMALFNRKMPTGVIIHSDRGSQYTSEAYQEMVTDYSLTGSMSRKGNCWDNAAQESFYGTAKQEALRGAIFKNLEEAKLEIFKYINSYYNTKRRHSTLDYKTPNQVEWELVQNVSVKSG